MSSILSSVVSNLGSSGTDISVVVGAMVDVTGKGLIEVNIISSRVG